MGGFDEEWVEFLLFQGIRPQLASIMIWITSILTYHQLPKFVDVCESFDVWLLTFCLFVKLL